MPLKAYLVQRMKLGIVKEKLAAWTIKRLKADNDNVSEETTTGFAGLAPENAEDYTALVAQGGEMQAVAQGQQADNAEVPAGANSVSVQGSAGTSVSLAAPSLGTTTTRGGGIIVPQCTKHALNTYYATDHLGTVRFTKTIDETGTEVATSTHDYEPFGVEITPTDECDNTHRFTGHERDLETGNDYMHFRFFSSNMGRFQKPDSNFDSPLSNPQGWNLYSYVKGNPVNFNDPTGHMQGEPLATKGVVRGGIPNAPSLLQNNSLGGGLSLGGTPWDLNFSAAYGAGDPGNTLSNLGQSLTPTAQTTMFDSKDCSFKLDPDLSSNSISPLVKAQDAALTTPAFAPRDHKTFCNFATFSIVTAMGADTTPFHYWDNGGVAQANDFLRYETTEGGKHAGQWKRIPAGEVQGLADKNQLVVGVLHGGNHGHLVTARPSWASTQGYADALGVKYKEGGKGPYIANIGAGEPWIGRAEKNFEWFVPAP